MKKQKNNNTYNGEFKDNLKINHDIKKKNWFNIGGKSKIFYKADNLKELINFLKKIYLNSRFNIAVSPFFSDYLTSKFTIPFTTIPNIVDNNWD